MKKYLRLLALALSFLLICLAFCGCIDLDDERKHHALWKDDEKTVILLNNKEYKLLPKCETLNPIEKFDYDYYVTENDVPLLSKSTYGDMVSLSADENFIIYNEYEEYKGICDNPEDKPFYQIAGDIIEDFKDQVLPALDDLLREQHAKPITTPVKVKFEELEF